MVDKANFMGIDPEQTRAASQQMDSTADNLGSMVSMLGSMLDSVFWEGDDAKRFMSDWNGSLRPELDRATETIRENAVELSQRAQMQEEASR
ncbi:WXG100 family type VII secretion target [Phytoactinopolyspora limicola]|uniref:WXG100 family type VII secretion target n=1 Tax=Phytoactinopolyspora limicola TaxID=2715536 RepID=UPI001408392B|nr:WXG100 family type VII secretion target [Phytoactinopolyspora limicola]